MKRLGLLPKLLFAIAVGILLGSIGPEWFIVNLPYTKTSLCYWCREVFLLPGLLHRGFVLIARCQA